MDQKGYSRKNPNGRWGLRINFFEPTLLWNFFLLYLPLEIPDKTTFNPWSPLEIPVGFELTPRAGEITPHAISLRYPPGNSISSTPLPPPPHPGLDFFYGIAPYEG